jgi:hypothetical protein
MTARQIASLFIKVAACYVLIRAIPDILTIVATAGTTGDFNMSHPLVRSIVLSVVGLPVLMLFIIKRSDRFAARITKDDLLPISLGSLTHQDIYALAFSLVGIVVIVDGITGLVYQLVYLRQLAALAGSDPPKVVFERQIYSGIASSLVALVIGVLLFLFPRGLSGFWQAIQRTRPMKES